MKNPHKLDLLQGASHADGNPVSYNFVVPELPLGRRAEICRIFCEPIATITKLVRENVQRDYDTEIQM